MSLVRVQGHYEKGALSTMATTTTMMAVCPKKAILLGKVRPKMEAFHHFPKWHHFGYVWPSVFRLFPFTFFHLQAQYAQSKPRSLQSSPEAYLKKKHLFHILGFSVNGDLTNGNRKETRGQWLPQAENITVHACTSLHAWSARSLSVPCCFLSAPRKNSSLLLWLTKWPQW